MTGGEKTLYHPAPQTDYNMQGEPLHNENGGVVHIVRVSQPHHSRHLGVFKRFHTDGAECKNPT